MRNHPAVTRRGGLCGAAGLSLALLLACSETQANDCDCDRFAAHPYDPSKSKAVDGVAMNDIEAAGAVAACRDAVAKFPDIPRFQYQLGRSLEAAGDVPAALQSYREAAEQGYAAAQGSLGTAYRAGQGVAQSDREALVWYRKAAEQGFSVAQFYLGIMLFNGEGTGEDASEEERWAEAVRWYRKAAEQGLAPAQYSLGPMYDHGLGGVEQSYSDALGWYRKAAEQGHGGAQYRLGAMYEEGLGVEKSRSDALTWYRQAADGGLEQAVEALGRLEGE